MKKHSTPWLNDEAAAYALYLRKNPDFVDRLSSSTWGDLAFDAELSLKILASGSMAKVWKYLNNIDTRAALQCPLWKHFLAEIQFAAKGPKAMDKRSSAERQADVANLGKHFEAASRIVSRYVDPSVGIGVFYGRPDLDEFFQEDDARILMRHLNAAPLSELFEKIPEWIVAQQSNIKSPQHKQVEYQYFVRRLHDFFRYIDPKSPRYALIAATCNATGLFEPCDGNRVRGTCQSA